MLFFFWSTNFLIPKLNLWLLLLFSSLESIQFMTNTFTITINCWKIFIINIHKEGKIGYFHKNLVHQFMFQVYINQDPHKVTIVPIEPWFICGCISAYWSLNTSYDGKQNYRSLVFLFQTENLNPNLSCW